MALPGDAFNLRRHPLHECGGKLSLLELAGRSNGQKTWRDNSGSEWTYSCRHSYSGCFGGLVLSKAFIIKRPRSSMDRMAVSIWGACKRVNPLILQGFRLPETLTNLGGR